MNKIDTIIGALELATETSEFERINTLYKQALAAAHELKALKPTHYVDHKNERNVVHYLLWKNFDDCEILKKRYTVPLYALDEVTK